MSLALLLLACHGEAIAPEAPVSDPATPALTERLRVPLPYGKPRDVPQLAGTVTLVQVASSHSGPGLMESSRGTLELSRGGETVRVDFDANKAFEAWGYKMAVFGASGSYELGVFPPGAIFEP